MRIFVILAAALLTAACASAPAQPVAVHDPANAEAPAPPVRYRSSLATYVSQRPVDPAPWGERNERVAPQPKQ